MSSSGGILSLEIKEKAALYASYMPFIKNGGLFVPTDKSYKIGDEIFVLISLMNDQEKIPISGKVVWVTPKNARSKKITVGVGFQFSQIDEGATKHKIETMLAAALNSTRPTHTL